MIKMISNEEATLEKYERIKFAIELKVGMRLEVIKDYPPFTKGDKMLIRMITENLRDNSAIVQFRKEGKTFAKRYEGFTPQESSEYFKVM